MAGPINVHEAKTHLSRLLERAHAGEEIVLAKGGVPYARLVPLEQPSARTPGVWRDVVALKPEFFEPLSDEELDQWEDSSR